MKSDIRSEVLTSRKEVNRFRSPCQNSWLTEIPANVSGILVARQREGTVKWSQVTILEPWKAEKKEGQPGGDLTNLHERQREEAVSTTRRCDLQVRALAGKNRKLCYGKR